VVSCGLSWVRISDLFLCSGMKIGRLFRARISPKLWRAHPEREEIQQLKKDVQYLMDKIDYLFEVIEKLHGEIEDLRAAIKEVRE
jgi:DNA mismatch repair protein MutH